MKIIIKNASGIGKPHKDAVMGIVMLRESRSVPMVEIPDFLDKGVNHRDVESGCVREFEINVWVIELETIESIFELSKELNQELIIGKNYNCNLDGYITVYNDYIE